MRRLLAWINIDESQNPDARDYKVPSGGAYVPQSAIIEMATRSIHREQI